MNPGPLLGIACTLPLRYMYNHETITSSFSYSSFPPCILTDFNPLMSCIIVVKAYYRASPKTCSSAGPKCNIFALFTVWFVAKSYLLLPVYVNIIALTQLCKPLLPKWTLRSETDGLVPCHAFCGTAWHIQPVASDDLRVTIVCLHHVCTQVITE